MSVPAWPSGGEREGEAAEAGGDGRARRVGRAARGDGGGHATGLKERESDVGSNEGWMSGRGDGCSLIADAGTHFVITR